MSRKSDEAGTQPAKHSKTSLLQSKRFTPQQKDYLRALLQDGESYSVAEAAQLLDKYLKQEAK
ncbi:hypothetical protein J4772_11485 [Cohnella sp. LGH]|uniref:hypothetical protein n=1 Tax=Cohnella sp. LGH TaxID=1619153 RepID=UPI001ADC9895|nr:hypothetical protein [Cohnella sp. LGH]QTH44962.1 hypothetical protein J4772_11485 [Cohnella sp. LGH]